jgi:hypothetical protein
MSPTKQAESQRSAYGKRLEGLSLRLRFGSRTGVVHVDALRIRLYGLLGGAAPFLGPGAKISAAARYLGSEAGSVCARASMGVQLSRMQAWR